MFASFVTENLIFSECKKQQQQKKTINENYKNKQKLIINFIIDMTKIK